MTVVVLLILAAVSLSLVLGQNGIITKAKEGSNTYQGVAANEQVVLNEIVDYIYGSNNAGKIVTKPYLPDITFSYVAGTNLDNGLVMKDSKENEYVWVEVPMDKTNVYKTATSNTDYANIEKDLQDYASIYRHSDYSDVWYSGCGIATATEYNNLKNKMLGSIYEHGGFWIGRYEAGSDDTRTSAGQLTTEVKIQQNKYPYNYVTCSQAQTQAADLSSGKSYTTSLLFGLQWDLTMKFFEQKGKPQADLKVNSLSWGNYIDSSFKITNTKAKYSLDLGNMFDDITRDYTKPSDRVLLTTGATDTNMFMNIYDMAGNEWEWTLEKSSNMNFLCSANGGCYFSQSKDAAVSTRTIYNTTSSYNNYGFRVTIYQ